MPLFKSIWESLTLDINTQETRVELRVGVCVKRCLAVRQEVVVGPTSLQMSSNTWTCGDKKVGERFFSETCRSNSRTHCLLLLSLLGEVIFQVKPELEVWLVEVEGHNKRHLDSWCRSTCRSVFWTHLFFSQLHVNESNRTMAAPQTCSWSSWIVEVSSNWTQKLRTSHWSGTTSTGLYWLKLDFECLPIKPKSCAGGMSLIYSSPGFPAHLEAPL